MASYSVPALLPTPISTLPQATVRDPNGLVPNSALQPYVTYAEKISDILGNYNGFNTGTHPLSAATTVGLPTSSLGQLLSVVFQAGSTAYAAYPMLLLPGTAATNVPYVQQPADFNTFTNPVIYQEVNWHSQAFGADGVSGAGYYGMRSQTGITPTAPADVGALKLFNNGGLLYQINYGGTVSYIGGAGGGAFGGQYASRSGYSTETINFATPFISNCTSVVPVLIPPGSLGPYYGASLLGLPSRTGFVVQYTSGTAPVTLSTSGYTLLYQATGT